MAGLTRVTGGGITDGTITNADINSSAAIDASKVSGLSTDSITEGNTTVEVVDTGSNGHITFDTEGTEKARFDTTGRLLVGHTSTTTPGGFSHQVQIHGTDQDTSSLSLISNAGANVHEAATITFGKTRGTSAGAANAISSGDTIGTIQFAAADNTDVASVAAAIRCSADGAVSGNDTPGRLVFQTTADGSSTPTERMRITNGGNVGIGTDSPMTDCQLTLGQSTAPKLGFSRTSTGGGGAFDGAIELNSDGHFAFRNGSNSTTASGLTERMRITNGGRVGIGTSSPDTTVDIEDSQAELIVKSTGSNPAGFRMIPNNETNALYMYADTNRNICWDDHATAKMRMQADGDLEISDGNLVLASGHGIDFSARTNNANMTSELLDEYEEGTWTPTWQATTDSGTFTGLGSYTKIGRNITIEMKQTGGNISASAGNYIISGCPFAPNISAHGSAGTWTNTSPSEGGQILVWISGKLYTANAISSIDTLRITCSYQSSDDA